MAVWRLQDSLGPRLIKALGGVLSLKGDLKVVYISYPKKLLTAARDLIDKGEYSVSRWSLSRM